jgi:predicted nicotinamide N-methyase
MEPDSILSSALKYLYEEPPFSHEPDVEGGELVVRLRVGKNCDALDPTETNESNPSHRTDYVDIKLKMPPSVVGSTGLMAHYLWNAGILLARFLALASSIREFSPGTDEAWTRPFELSGMESVLELGAAAGLPGISVSLLLPCTRVVVSDYPTPQILDTLLWNLERNETSGTVVGHIWGEPGALRPHAESGEQEIPQSFDLILLADTFYSTSAMPLLLSSVERFSRKGTRMLMATGLHVGVDPPRTFIELARRAGWTARWICVVQVTGDLLDRDSGPGEFGLGPCEVEIPTDEDWDGLVPGDKSEEERGRLKKATVVVCELIRS